MNDDPVSRVMREINAPRIAQMQQDVRDEQERRAKLLGIDVREVRARDSFYDPDQRLELVGWYCAGGHLTESTRGLGMVPVKGPSIRLDDPCEFGQPVFVIKPP